MYIFQLQMKQNLNSKKSVSPEIQSAILNYHIIAYCIICIKYACYFSVTF